MKNKDYERVREEFEVRIYTHIPSEIKWHGEDKGVFGSLEEAHKHLKHFEQCTWDDIEEQSPDSYSVIFCYRDEEEYNTLYFIEAT